VHEFLFDNWSNIESFRFNALPVCAAQKNSGYDDENKISLLAPVIFRMTGSILS